MSSKRIVLAFLALVWLIPACYAAGPVIREISSIAKTVCDSLNANKKMIVAVTDFTDLEGNVNVLGRFLAEEISISLASGEKNITIIDRNQLKKALAEKSISTTGIIDPGFAKQIGRISGAEVILTGSAYPVADSLYVSVKAIDVDTAKIFAGMSTTIERNQILDDLIKISFKIDETSKQPQKISFTPQVKEAYDFILILKESAMDGNTISLGFEVKNNLDEARFLTIDSVRAIDDTGKVYYPSSLTAGQLRAYIGESGKIQSVNRGIVSDNFDIWLRENQQIRIQITMRNISQKAKQIGFLEMTVAPVKIMDSQGTHIRLEDDLATIQFTNIPIIREKDGSKY